MKKSKPSKSASGEQSALQSKINQAGTEEETERCIEPSLPDTLFRLEEENSAAGQISQKSESGSTMKSGYRGTIFLAESGRLSSSLSKLESLGLYVRYPHERDNDRPLLEPVIFVVDSEGWRSLGENICRFIPWCNWYGHSG